MKPGAFPPAARDAVHALRASRIREVANTGMGRPDVLAFWFGDGPAARPEWFRKDPVFDAQIRARFGAVIESVT